jgi:N,N'-diacetyllegionaminate synthase
MTQIICDACGNHLGDRRLMEAMIASAADAGVDFIKWQTFRSDKLTQDWPDRGSALAYYKSLELSEDDHEFIIERCNHFGIKPLFTAFTLESVDLLKQLGMKHVKIASPDANSWTLIDRCLDAFEHVFISTGCHTDEEVDHLLQYLISGGRAYKCTILHCVSEYPTPLAHVNMKRMLRLKGNGFDVGWSDHTQSLDAAKLAIACGADVVERHYTLGRDLPGKDHFVSSTPDEFRRLLAWRNLVGVMMGSGNKQMSETEWANREKYRGRWGDNR